MYQINFLFGLLNLLNISVNKSKAQNARLMLLQTFSMALMAVVMVGISTIAFAADVNGTEMHDVGTYESSSNQPAKTDASKKIYPSRAVQGIDAPLAAGATLHKMTLSHHELEPWSFVPKRNDRIEIKNLSDITHALYVTYPDGTIVNLEIQIPGDVVGWTVPENADGEYIFRCWIHPVIRAKMLIEN